MTQHIHRDHIIATGGGALTGGAIGAALGALVGGPGGMALGGIAGTAVGAVAGDHIGDQLDMRGDLGHFASIYHTMPYYVSEMEWPDYEPAYRYAMEQYDARRGQSVEQAEHELRMGWMAKSGGSHLTWEQVEPVFEHVWQSYAEADAGVNAARSRTHGVHAD